MTAPTHAPLTETELELTTEWLASQQKPSGEIPWYTGGKMDPWDHIHGAMALSARGRHDAATAAYRYMAHTQDPNGAWATERRGGKVTRSTQETNHAAYIATGVWYAYSSHHDEAFLREMWPCVERAIDLVVSMQLPTGAIAWALKNGKPWQAPLLTGSSSIHGSLVCAIRIAEALGHERPTWREARARLARVVRHNPSVFTDTDLPQKPGWHSMDWYYPVLGGAVRGELARQRLRSEMDAFVAEGVGCRCVRDKPWYTIAESCELVLALDACGFTDRARDVLSWTRWLRNDEGAYWTGATHPAREIFPDGERTTWTAASVLIATDALYARSSTSRFFRDLEGGDLSAPARPRVEAPTRPSIDAWRTPAE